MTERFGAISFVASDTPEAQAALDKLVERYGNAIRPQPMSWSRSAATG